MVMKGNLKDPIPTATQLEEKWYQKAVNEVYIDLATLHQRVLISTYCTILSSFCDSASATVRAGCSARDGSPGRKN